MDHAGSQVGENVLSSEIDAQQLPEAVVQAYKNRGINRLYDWQAECLSCPGVGEGRNLVYCAPTSGGKTLVSEVLLLRRVFKMKKRAIFVLPYVSIVSEKANDLQALCKSTGALVKAFFGGSPESIKEPFDIAVCTIEKANALVNFLVEQGQLAELVGTLVVDELHLVGDGSRGYLLEIFLSKVLFLAPSLQVIGLSATLPNVEDIARWLDAVLYQTNYRPVPLSEFVLTGRQLLNPDGDEVREISFDGLPPEVQGTENSGLLAATWEVVREGHNVLVFCSSKVKCERAAEFLAGKMPSAASATAGADRARLLEEMQRQIGGADPVLAKSVPAGVAFHHSGLSAEERSLVERGYKEGAISVICATSTLAAGVNLPARRVVFQTPYMGNQLLDATQYKQMSGRAGRAGQGTVGESVMIAPSNVRRQVLELVRQCLPRVASCLRDEQRGLKRLLLEVLCVTPQLGAGEDLIRFCASTLLTTQKKSMPSTTAESDPARRHPEIASAMKWLLEHDMARLDERTNAYTATPLGRAVCTSGLEPKQGFVLFQELQRARTCISLDTDLHVCYLVTPPPDSQAAVDWGVYSRVLPHLSSAERRVAERVGIRLDLVDQAEFQGRLPQKITQSMDGTRVMRFYSALVLWALLHETPAPVLLRRFALGRGQLQQLQQASASFTHTVAVFCNRLQWYTLEALILSFQQRLALGVRLELVPLMQISGMDCTVARALYEHGFTTPVGVAGARPPEILRVLRKTLPHNVPSASLPESNAERLITAAAGVAKESLKEKRRQARMAREGGNVFTGLTAGTPAFEGQPPAKKQRLSSASLSRRSNQQPRHLPPQQQQQANNQANSNHSFVHDQHDQLRIHQSAHQPHRTHQPHNQPNNQPRRLQHIQPHQPHQLHDQLRNQPHSRPHQLHNQPHDQPHNEPHHLHELLHIQPHNQPHQQIHQDHSQFQLQSLERGSLQHQQSQQVSEQHAPMGANVLEPFMPANRYQQEQLQLNHVSNQQRQQQQQHTLSRQQDTNLHNRQQNHLGMNQQAQGNQAVPTAPTQVLPQALQQTQLIQRSANQILQPSSHNLQPQHQSLTLSSHQPRSRATERGQTGCGRLSEPQQALYSPSHNVTREDPLTPGQVEFSDSIGRCATPCRAQDGAAPSPATTEEDVSPLSAERLSEGLRRLGRQSLTPRDLEAVRGSPGSQVSGVASGGGERSQSSFDSQSALTLACAGPHAAMASETSFLASPLAAAGAQLPLPPLQVLTGDAVSRLGSRLASACWIGAAVVAGGEGGEEALCLSLGPVEAYCLQLPLPTSEKVASPAGGPAASALWSWFMQDQHLCITPDAKELVAAFLKRGIDIQCAVAEPRVAYWLLDPDDKHHTSTSELAARCQINLAASPSSASGMTGSWGAMSPVLRARLASSWPEAFLALPLLACLLRRLSAQDLHGSFWWIEMPISVVLAWMEHIGFGCETKDPLHTLSHILYKMAAIQERVKGIVGRQVMLSSSEDVGRALFEDLGLPLPRGVRMRRKPNGRMAYKSPQELLRRLPPHQIVELVLEHRQLAHVSKRIEGLLRAGEPPRMEPLCQLCASSFGAAQGLTISTGPLWQRPRIRAELVQTGTATGRLSTGAGSVPLLCMENAFEISEVKRPSLHEELCSGRSLDVNGARVFVSVAAEAPPKARRLREGVIESVSACTCAEPLAGSTATGSSSSQPSSLAAYWLARGWQSYADEGRTRSIRQVLVRHGGSQPLAYPADQVWRLAAPVDIADETPQKLQVNPRRLLVAEPGYVLISIDYSQLEVRLMAHFSNDSRFVDILHRGGDIFRHVAAGWLRKCESQVSAEERSGAKRICYGLVYGIGAGRLAAELGISQNQAREFQSSFTREYSGVAAWVTACREQARQCGYVETLHGRRRFLPALASGSLAERSRAERQAVNTACQASAADLVKAAMLGIHGRLKQLRSHGSDGRCRMAGRLLLQVHDELILEVEETRWEEVRDLVISEMINAGQDLKVPLQVKWRVGKSWGSLDS
eukprot:TRINITY_DN6591_c0_g2_i1.p1 TRINITY_DN6591_c0_g2~~TRINITY_DN6591_c0_g2_i1.p1  ORF type:complete len:2016 (-),score=351.16 TRINITY_DN6591_c0_g2_i1:69-6116(-)